MVGACRHAFGADKKSTGSLSRAITFLALTTLLTSYFVVVGTATPAVAAPADTATVTPGINPDSYAGCVQSGYIDFEGLPDQYNLSASTVNGVKFTTTGGYTWSVGAWSTGNYNGKYPNGSYTSQGNDWAWLGVNQGAGRIDFVNGAASYVSLLVSASTPVQLDAYTAGNSLVATAGPMTNNINTGQMAELKITRAASDIAYVIVHDTGNYFLVDSICTNAAGTSTAPIGGPVPSQMSGDKSSNPTQCMGGTHPINCATGDFWHTFTDLTVPGRGLPLDLNRTYNSELAASDSPFGFGWSSSYTMKASTDAAGVVTVTQEGGVPVVFTPAAGGSFTAPPRALAKLVNNSDGTLTFTRRQRELFTFGSDGRLVRAADLNGETTALTYDSDGHLQQVTDPAGRNLTFSYNGAGRISSVKDPMDRTYTYLYDGSGNLTDVQDPAGGHWQFTYDASHLLLTMRSPRFAGDTTTNPSPVITNTYDAAHRVVTQTDELGHATQYDYTSIPSSTKITDARGNVSVQEYSFGEMIKITRGVGTPEQASWSYSYDPATLGITRIVDPNGNVTTATYDSAGNQTSSTDQLGRTTSRTFDGLNDLTGTTSPGGHTSSYTYDTAGNIITATDPAGKATTFSYGNSSHPSDLTQVTDADGRVSSATYDAQGNVSSISLHPSDGVTNTTAFTYDAVGEQICEASANATAASVNCPAAESPPVPKTTARSFDALGRLTSSTDPNGNTTRYEYDANGNRVKLTDANGNATSYAYDAANQLIKVARADGTTIAASYDANGNAVTYTDGAGKVTRYGYNSLNRQVSSTDPLNRATHYSYDGNGNRTSLVDASSRTTTYEYDAGNQLTKVTYSDGSTPTVTYTYTADGQRESMADGTGTSSYTYDAVGRLTHTTNGGGASIGYVYDNAGHVTALTYPSGQTVTKTYDGAGHVAGITDWLGKSFNFNYDANGNIVSQADPNGVTVTNQYNPADQLLGITAKTSASTLATFSYTRDALGQVTGDTTTGALADTKTYGYTSLNQLGSQNSAAYSYDPADNLIKLANGTAQTFDAANQLTSSTPTASAAVTTDQVVSADQKTASSTITSPKLTTTKPDELILAFVSADGPSNGTQKVTKVTANGLTFTLASQSNKTWGTAEVWQAHATSTFTGKVTATLSKGGYDGSITVATFTGAGGAVGATGTGGGITGAPSTTLTTTADNSVVWAAGHNWTHSAAVTPVAGQTLVHLYRDARVHDTYWTQSRAAVAHAGTKVTIADTAPRRDRWQLAAVEIKPASSGSGGAPTTFTYDAQGNRVTSAAGGATTTLQYDQANRLIGYGADATYRYDGDGLRTGKTVSGTTTAFAYDPNGSLPLLLADGDDSYVYGPDGTPLEKVTGTTPIYLFHDQQGSTRILTDASAAVVGAYTFDAFGKALTYTGKASSALQYASEYFDSESGYTYLRARSYDAATAQFISSDPLSALSLQRHGYTQNNPLNLSDPTGLWTVTDCYSGGLTFSHATGGIGMCFNFGREGYSVTWTRSYGLDTGFAGASVANTYGIAGGDPTEAQCLCSLDVNGSIFAGVGGTGSISRSCDGSFAVSGGPGLGTLGAGVSVTGTVSGTLITNSWSQWAQDWHDTIFHPTTIWRGLGF